MYGEMGRAKPQRALSQRETPEFPWFCGGTLMQPSTPAQWEVIIIILI